MQIIFFSFFLAYLSINQTAQKKTYLYNFDPLKQTPPLYSKTGVYRGVHYFSFLLQNIDCGYSLELLWWGSSNDPQSMFWAERWKISEFSSENFQFFCGEIFNIFD